MPNFPLTQSPNSTGFQSPQGEDDEKVIFTQQFSELAYRAFQKTQPELMQNVITFRVLDVDVDNGTGIGSFILQYANDVVFVPCVVADSAIKPLEMFYSRTTDRFFPLTSNWLKEATKDDVSELGSPVKPPKEMSTDVDIRNIVLPPTTSRFSYASDEESAAWLPFEAALRHAELPSPQTEPKFPEMLKAASAPFKRAFAKVLERQPKLANHYAKFYGVKPLLEALAVPSEKTAAYRAEKPMKRDVFLMTASTPIQEARKELEPDELATGYKVVRTHGFFIKDRRTKLNDIFSFSESDLVLVEPNQSGVYDIYMAEGKIERVLILKDPPELTLQDSDNVSNTFWNPKRSKQNSKERAGLENNYIVLFPDGRYAYADRILAAPVVEFLQKDVERFIQEMTAEKPKNEEFGCFLSPTTFEVRGFKPGYARDIVTVDKNVTVIRYGGMTIRLDDRMPKGAIIQGREQATAMLSGSYRWFKAKTSVSRSEILVDSRHIIALIEQGLELRGDKRITIKAASDGTFFVGEDRSSLPAVRAAVRAAELYNVPVQKVAQAMVLVGNHQPVHLWSTKTAAGESLNPDGSPMDPAAAPQGPPPPSGIDLATGEKIQQIQGQIAALQQMLQMLTEVQQRAQLIDQGGGAAAAPAAAAQMAAGPGALQGQTPMVPSPAPGGGMQPPAGGGMQPPSDGVTPVGAPMPPQEPPPPPVMTEQEPSAEALQSQVSPDYVDSAAQLQDAGIFDAAAVASLAKQRGINTTIQSYMPTLERALDNLARTLLLFGIKENQIKENIGNDAHQETEQHLRDVFSGLGDTILDLKQYGQQLGSNKPNNAVY